MIDPRNAPVVGTDDHLPAVQSDRLSPDALKRRFQSPASWAPEVREEPRFTDRPVVPAAVLVAIIDRPSPTLLLTQRTSHLPTHAGQIAFPGGKIDATDGNPVDAALREAWEEVGLDPRAVELLGCLPEYTTGTAYAVTPVVGVVPAGRSFSLRPNPGEVAATFEVPLDFLMNPAHHRRHQMWWDGRLRHWFSMPYHDGQEERFIWGATAGMVRNLYRFLSA